MRVITSVKDFPALSGSVGLVPTMGALHAGHLSLIHKSVDQVDHTVVSLFVNPKQFGRGEDIDRYPRNFERDRDLCEGNGADILFVPHADEMYAGPGTTVHVKDLSDVWEGASRPGHFDGVATVVTKLFNIVRPTLAAFGLKDLQQCMVVRRLVTDLNLPIHLEFCLTVREADGLAMSSRNAYLDDVQREIAPNLYRVLSDFAKKVRMGEALAENDVEAGRRTLESVGFQVDYLAWVDLPNMTNAVRVGSDQALIGAAKLGTTRLIDNIVL